VVPGGSAGSPNDIAHQLRAGCPPIRILWSAGRHRRIGPGGARTAPRLDPRV